MSSLPSGLNLEKAIKKKRAELAKYLRLQDLLEDYSGFSDFITGDEYSEIRQKLDAGLEQEAALKFIDYFLASSKPPANRKWGTMRHALNSPGHELARGIICGTVNLDLQEERERLVTDVYKRPLTEEINGRQVAELFLPFSQSEREKINCDLERNGNRNTISLILRYMMRHQNWFPKFVKILDDTGKKRIAKELRGGDPDGDDSPYKNTRSKGKKVPPMQDDPEKLARQLRGIRLSSPTQQANDDRISAAPAASRNFAVAANMSRPSEMMMERNNHPCGSSELQATEFHRRNSSDKSDYESCESVEGRDEGSPGERGKFGFHDIYQDRQAQKNARTTSSSQSSGSGIPQEPPQETENREGRESPYNGYENSLPHSPALQNAHRDNQPFSPDNVVLNENYFKLYSGSSQVVDSGNHATYKLEGNGMYHPLVMREDDDPPPYSPVDLNPLPFTNSISPTDPFQIENLNSSSRAFDYHQDQALRQLLGPCDLNCDSLEESEIRNNDAEQQTSPKRLADSAPPPQTYSNQLASDQHFYPGYRHVEAPSSMQSPIEGRPSMQRPPVIRCQSCSRPYTSRSELDDHERSCSSFPASKSSSLEPEATRKNQRPQTIRCKSCRTAFPDESSLKSHACSLPEHNLRRESSASAASKCTQNPNQCANSSSTVATNSLKFHQAHPKHHCSKSKDSTATEFSHVTGKNISRETKPQNVPQIPICMICKEIFPTQKRLNDHSCMPKTSTPPPKKNVTTAQTNRQKAITSPQTPSAVGKQATCGSTRDGENQIR